MELRRAKPEDALDVLAWRNDQVSIAASKSGPVDRNEHLAWFPNAIASDRHMIFIAEEDGRKLGMVRFDRTDGAWVVSINLAAAERSKGYGGQILRAGMAALGPYPLLAEIRTDNLRSIRVFERCGFRLVGAGDGFLHFMKSDY